MHSLPTTMGDNKPLKGMALVAAKKQAANLVKEHGNGSGISCNSVVESNNTVVDKFLEVNRNVPGVKVAVKRGRPVPARAARSKKKMFADEEEDEEDDGEEEEDDSDQLPSSKKGKFDQIKDINQIGTMNAKNGRCRNAEIVEMTESTHLYRNNDFTALYRNFVEDGYILLRNIIPRNLVLQAGLEVDAHLKAKGTVRPNGTIAPQQRGMTVETTTGTVISGADLYAEGSVASEEEAWRRVGNSPSMQQALTGPAVSDVLRGLAIGASAASAAAAAAAGFGGGGVQFLPSVLSPYTWLRIKSKNEMTPEHADYFHFKRTTPLLNSAAEQKELEDEIKEAVAAVEAEKKAEEARAKGEQPPPPPVVAQEEEGDEVCEVCRSGADSSNLLLCGECDKGYHTYCLSPKLACPPEGDWFCAECQPQPVLGTCWVPLQDLSLRNGVLTVLRGSQNLPDFDNSSGIKQIPKSFRTSMLQAPWHIATRLQAGDVILFPLKAVHSTTVNQCNSFRLSADLRWCLKPQRPNYGLTGPSKAVLQVEKPM